MRRLCIFTASGKEYKMQSKTTDKKSRKLAVIFPGIGYHTDKPLLYYSKKSAKSADYEIVEVPYGNFPQGVKGSPEKMAQCFNSARQQAEKLLEHVDFALYEELLFISKSVGTAVASEYANRHGLHTRNIFYTPVAQTFPFVKNGGIVFHGTADPWVETSIVKNCCEEKNLPLYITENANHSLETGEVMTDLQNMERIMEITGKYIENLRC